MRRSIIVVILAVFAIFSGCSKYKRVGPEFYVDIQFKRDMTISPGESVITNTVTAVRINGHPIELAQTVNSSKSRFEVETEEYGTIQFSVEGSGMASFLSLQLTKAQQESIRALGPPPSGEIRSIAVLPFENVSGDPEQEPFADRMTETLISGLANIGAFDKVIPFTSVMTLKGGSYDLYKIAQDLGVDAVLVGSVRLMESRVRLTVQLIYVPTDLHVWTETYERDIEELGDVVREVTSKVPTSVPVRAERD